jgi:predicted nucleotidyltransferase
MTGPSLPPAAPDLRSLLGRLCEHRVEFVVVGGIAGIAQGSSYPSYDLDVAYSREPANLERLATALGEIGVSLRGAPADLPFQLDARTLLNGTNFTFETPHGDLDLLGEIAGIKSYRELRDAAEVKEIAGVEVPVASLDHLIAMKRAAKRTKDKLMLEEYIVIADEQQRLREAQGE